MSKFLNTFCRFLISIPFEAFCTYIFMQMWNWFIVPIMHFAPLNFVLAYGFLSTLALLKPTKLEDDEDDEATKWARFWSLLVTKLFVFLIVWGVGALLH